MLRTRRALLSQERHRESWVVPLRGWGWGEVWPHLGKPPSLCGCGVIALGRVLGSGVFMGLGASLLAARWDLHPSSMASLRTSTRCVGGKPRPISLCLSGRQPRKPAWERREKPAQLPSPVEASALSSSPSLSQCLCPPAHPLQWASCHPGYPLFLGRHHLTSRPCSAPTLES